MGAISDAEIVQDEVIEVPADRRSEVPDVRLIASSSKRPLSPSSTDNEEAKFAKFEELFPEAISPLSKILNGINVKADSSSFDNLMTLVDVSKRQYQPDYSRVLEYSTVNDLLEMKGDAWVEYLAHPALLSATALQCCPVLQLTNMCLS